MSKGKPRVSFVVPVYNKQSYIAECLSSLVTQSVKDIEIIVVDDKSTDDSLNIVKWHASRDKRIKLFELDKNRGRSYARNFGNSEASAPIICVQDADDLSLPDRAKLTLNGFKKNIDIFYGGFLVSDIYGSPIEQIRAVPFDMDRVFKDKVTYIGHSTMAYKKGVVLKTPYDVGEYCRLGLDDWKLQLDLNRRGCKFGFTEEMLMIYRQVSNSISSTRNATDVLKVKNNYLTLLRKGK